MLAHHARTILHITELLQSREPTSPPAPLLTGEGRDCSAFLLWRGAGIRSEPVLITLAIVLLTGCATAIATPSPAPTPMSRAIVVVQVQPTSTPGCPPRPTRTPVVVPTFRDTPKPPTPAPPPTPGPTRIVTPALVPTLVHPLESEEEILRVLLNSDLNSAEWDNPWCLDTPRFEPDRITRQWYPNQSAYDGSSRPAEYGGQDPIWVVTIRGDVRLSIRCMACTEPIKAGGVVYIVDQKTGQIFGMRTLPLP